METRTSPLLTPEPHPFLECIRTARAGLAAFSTTRKDKILYTGVQALLPERGSRPRCLQGTPRFLFELDDPAEGELGISLQEWERSSAGEQVALWGVCSKRSPSAHRIIPRSEWARGVDKVQGHYTNWHFTSGKSLESQSGLDGEHGVPGTGVARA